MGGAARRFCTSCGSELEEGATFCTSCGTVAVTLEESSGPSATAGPSTEIRDPYIGTELAGYLIEAQLGQGGMGVVYRARHLRLGRHVALKLIAPGHVSKAQFRDRFVAESRAAAAIDHPNILPLYEADEHDGLLYMVTRLVEGTDLKELLAAEGALEPRRAISIVSQIGAALDAAHSRRIVHRDIKPANVLIEPGTGPDGSDHAYLTDFGLTKQLSGAPGLTQTGQFVGTIDYVAPEQIEGGAIDGRADIYSLGCLLYECLIGKAPYFHDSEATVLWAHLNASPPRPSEARPELPPGLDDVLAMAMAKNPEERFARCSALTAAASAELATGDAPLRPPPPPEPPTASASAAGRESGSPAVAAQPPPAPPPPIRGRGRGRKWAGLALLAALLAGGGIAVGAFVVAGGPAEKTRTVPVEKTPAIPAPAPPPSSEPRPPDAQGKQGSDSPTSDDLLELEARGDADASYGDFGTKTIAGKTFEGVSLLVERTVGNAVTIDTKGRYQRMSGVVGINEEGDCPETAASAAIIDDRGKRLWSLERITLGSPPEPFTVPLRKRASVRLTGLSLAESEDSCDFGDHANLAWGNVTFIK